MEGNQLEEIKSASIGSIVSEYEKNVDDKWFMFDYHSYIAPSTRYKLDLDNMNLTVVSKSEIKLPDRVFNSDDYGFERVWYTSKDGTRVPMSLLWNK